MSETSKKDHPPASEPSPGPSLGRSFQTNSSISLKLRELYGAVEDQAIPDRFLDLLQRLEQAERNASSVGSK